MSTILWLRIVVISLAFSETLLMPMDGLGGKSYVRGQKYDLILPTSPFDHTLAQLADQETLSDDDVASLVARYDYVGSLRMRETGQYIDRNTLIERRLMVKRKHAALRWVLNEVRRWRSPNFGDPAAGRLNEHALWQSFFRYQELQKANASHEERKKYIQEWFNGGLYYMVRDDNNVPTLQAFVAAGLTPKGCFDKAELWSASHFRARACVQWLLLHGHDPNAVEFNPLEAAIEMDYADIAEDLLRAGANPNLGFRTPLLSLACEQANRRIVELLVEYGADQNNVRSSKLLDVVLHELIKAKDAKDQERVAKLHDVVEFLTTEGPRYQQQFEADRAQLFVALQSHDFAYIEAHYHRLNASTIKNGNGDTLLVAAARSGDPDAVNWLLENHEDSAQGGKGYEAYKVSSNSEVKGRLERYKEQWEASASFAGFDFFPR